MNPKFPVPAVLRALAQGLAQGAIAAPAQPQAPLLVPAADPPLAPTQLARGLPSPRGRSEALALYTRCLVWYREQVQPAAPVDDAALAAAYFALANLAALQPLRIGREQLLEVELQTRHWLRAFGAWDSLPLPDQQLAFEQFAIVGVLVTESRAAAERQGALARAHVRQAARGYLQQWLGLSAEALRLTDQGLAIHLTAAA